MTRVWRVRAALLTCVGVLVGCDHASKRAAEVLLRERGAVDLVPGVVDLRYTENRDVAFDAFSRLSLHPPPWALAVLVVLGTLAVLVAWARRGTSRLSEQAGFALVTAGAVGNALDRIARGHVIDFIHVRFWPVFNVADALVVAGIALIVLARWDHPRPRAEA